MKKPEFTKIINDEIDNVLALREFLSDEEDGPSIGSAEEAADVDMSPYINTMRENIVKSVQVRLRFINKYLLCDGRRPKKKEMFVAFNRRKPVPGEPGPGLFLLPGKGEVSYPKLKALAEKKGKFEVLKEKLPEMVEDIVNSVSPKASFFGLSSSHNGVELRLGVDDMVYAEYTLKKMNPCKYFAGLTNIKFYEKNQDNKNNDALAALRGMQNDQMQATVQKFIIEAAIRPHLAEIEKLLESIAFSKDVEAAPTNTPGKNTPGKNTSGKNTPGKNTPGKNTPGKDTSTPREEPKNDEIKILSQPARAWSKKQNTALVSLASNPRVKRAPKNIDELEALLRKVKLLGTPVQKESLSIIDKYILKEQELKGSKPAAGSTQTPKPTGGETSSPDAQPSFDEKESSRLLAIKTALLRFQKENGLTETEVYDMATHDKMKEKYPNLFPKGKTKTAPAAPAAAKTRQQTQPTPTPGKTTTTTVEAKYHIEFVNVKHENGQTTATAANLSSSIDGPEEGANMIVKQAAAAEAQHKFCQEHGEKEGIKGIHCIKKK